LRGNQTLTPWQQSARQKAAMATVKSQKSLSQRPEWDSRPATATQDKLSHAELLQRKLNSKSKNSEAAKAELQSKMDALKQGQLPEEYKDIVKPKKKFTSKQAFIENKELEYQYSKGAMIPKPPTKSQTIGKSSTAKQPLNLNF
jgi:hypothetical protein